MYRILQIHSTTLIVYEGYAVLREARMPYVHPIPFFLTTVLPCYDELQIFPRAIQISSAVCTFFITKTTKIDLNKLWQSYTKRFMETRDGHQFNENSFKIFIELNYYSKTINIYVFR